MASRHRSRPASLLLPLLAAAAAAAACGPEEGSPGAPPLTGHDEPEDLVVPPGDEGKSDAFSSTFNRNRIVAEGFFSASWLVGGDAVQVFLESTPYGTRCWLADATMDGKRAADVIAGVAADRGLNPIVLLARMQVEKSLISKTVPPGGHAIDYAFGCGCPDDRECDESFKGLDRQLRCAAASLRNLRDASVEGSGEWVRGRARKSSDGLTVVPANHATAALYGYTPWVLEGEGGNWLVWNVTRKYAIHFAKLGLVDLDDPRLGDPWVGRPCSDHAECDFAADGSDGFCLVWDAAGERAGYCSLPCEGYCPDLPGHSPTFCAAQDEQTGFCAPRAGDGNGDCAAIPGTVRAEAERFVGGSSAPAVTATVCLPSG